MVFDVFDCHSLCHHFISITVGHIISRKGFGCHIKSYEGGSHQTWERFELVKFNPKRYRFSFTNSHIYVTYSSLVSTIQAGGKIFAKVNM